MSSFLDSCRASGSQKRQRSQGSGVVVAKPGIVVTFGIVSGVYISKISSVIRIGGVVVRKRRIVVSFRFVSRLHKEGLMVRAMCQKCVMLAVVVIVGVFDIFLLGFLPGAARNYNRSVRTSEKALNFLPVAEDRYSVYTSRTGYAFHVGNICKGLSSAGSLQIKKACNNYLSDL